MYKYECLPGRLIEIQIRKGTVFIETCYKVWKFKMNAKNAANHAISTFVAGSK